MKQEMSSVDVAAIVTELRPRLNDSKIGKIYQHSPDEMRIGLHIFGEGRTNLIIEAGRRMHITKYPQTAQKVAQAFPMLLRKYLTGGRITDIMQYDFDRIIEIHIRRGEDETILIAELFARGNVVLLDAEKRIILPLKSISYKDRKVRRGEIYELPQPQVSPVTASREELVEMFSHSDADIVRTMATRMNVGGQYAEEICLRAGIDKKTPASQLTDVTPLLASLQEVFKPLSTELKPHIVLKNGKEEDVLPIELTQYGKNEKRSFGTFNEALDEYFSKKEDAKKQEKIEETKKEKPGLLEYRLQKQVATLQKFREDEKKLIIKGELIYAHYQTCDGILNTIKAAREKGYSWDDISSTLKNSDVAEAKAIRSIVPAKGIITVTLDGQDVELDIRLTLPQNSQVYYDRAKKLASKIKGAQVAIGKTKELSEKEQVPEVRKKTYKAHKPKWYEQFRWFYSSDGFLVIGGKDAQDNEDIVSKYLEKRDIFFHTQVSGSPAVVVKTEGKEVPDTTLEEAAQFAVSYSGVWKSGQASGDCYWVNPEQVSKTAESGEYVAKGAFVIRGKRNFFKDVRPSVALGIESLKETEKLIGGPLSAVRKRAVYVIEVEQGEFNQNDIAKKIYRMMSEKYGDRKMIQVIAPVDKIAGFLPAGGSRVKE
jgi:predicted ribosome quality control (RQC) complex YloA/Tae2 family protein